MTAVVVISGTPPRVVKVQQTGLQGPSGPQSVGAQHNVTASYAVVETSGAVNVGASALAGNIVVTAPAAPAAPMEITVSIDDTSLAAFHVTFDGNGKTVKGPNASGPTYVITKEDWGTGTVTGPSITFVYNGLFWRTK